VILKTNMDINHVAKSDIIIEKKSTANKFKNNSLMAWKLKTKW